MIREPVTAPAPLPVVPPLEQSVAEVPESLPIERSLSLGQTAYERLAAQVLRYGLDGLPASPTVASLPLRGRGLLPPARCCKKNSANFSILETPHETNDCLAPLGGRQVAVGRLGPAAARPSADGDHTASGRRAGPGSQIPARPRANQARAGQRRDLLSSRCHHDGGDLLVAQGQGASAAWRFPRLARHARLR